MNWRGSTISLYKEIIGKEFWWYYWVLGALKRILKKMKNCVFQCVLQSHNFRWHKNVPITASIFGASVVIAFRILRKATSRLGIQMYGYLYKFTYDKAFVLVRMISIKNNIGLSVLKYIVKFSLSLKLDT